MRGDSSRHCASARPGSPIPPGSVNGMTTPAPEPLPEVAVVARDLLRMNTVNWGGGRSEGEREAAEYLEARLAPPGRPRRMSGRAPGGVPFGARGAGGSRSRPALGLLGHTAAVPADAKHWSADP